jgi:hypothetical protein
MVLSEEKFQPKATMQARAETTIDPDLISATAARRAVEMIVDGAPM